ncbi:MAG: ABC transporter permease [Planctomycetes bacterium]|nr:ABC transporter permease [Planctomycetota bacterium]
MTQVFARPEVRLLLISAVALAGIILLAFLGRIPLKYNLRNLTVRWRTTIMTALAFTMVIGLLTVMLAFVNGMAKLIESSGRPGNLLILAQGATDEAFSTLAYGDTDDIKNQPGILQENGQPLVSRETYLVVNQPIAKRVPGRPRRRFLQLRGVEDAALAGGAHGIKLYDGGRWISAAGATQVGPSAGAVGKDETLYDVVIGEGIAQQLWFDRPVSERDATRLPQRLTVGDRVQLGERQGIVVGVMQSAGSTFDSEMWVKNSVVRENFGKNAYTSMVLKTPGPEEAAKLKKYFNDDYKKASLQALTESEYYSGLSQTSKQFLYASIFLAIIIAIGGIFGVMNTMFAAISQRTKDIGVLRIIGFSRWQILLSFLLESIVIGLIGGLLGLGLGMLCDGVTATSIVSSGPGGGKSVVLRLTVDGQILAVGLLLTLAMGFIGGLFPALLSAVRLKPLEALR